MIHNPMALSEDQITHRWINPWGQRNDKENDVDDSYSVVKMKPSNFLGTERDCL